MVGANRVRGKAPKVWEVKRKHICRWFPVCHPLAEVLGGGAARDRRGQPLSRWLGWARKSPGSGPVVER